MELTEKQEKGLEVILARYKSGYKYTTISGYAQLEQVRVRL